MIKWKKSTKNVLVNGVRTPIPFFEIYKWNGDLLLEVRCLESSIEQIKRILMDAVYCEDYTEYFSCLARPTNTDESILEIAELVKKQAIH